MEEKRKKGQRCACICACACVLGECAECMVKVEVYSKRSAGRKVRNLKKMFVPTVSCKWTDIDSSRCENETTKNKLVPTDQLRISQINSLSDN